MMQTEVSSTKISQDGGYASRKLWMGLLAMVLMLVSGGMTIWITSATVVLPTVVGGIVGIYGIYCGANVVTKNVSASIEKNRHGQQ